MKRFFVFIALTACLNGCVEPSPPKMPKSAYKPVLMDRETLQKSVGFEPARDLIKPGKIYIKDNYIFISEQYKGVHVYNNSDPSNPKETGLISVPGCLDMAVKNSTLYVDNSTDLVAIDLSDPTQPTVTKRIENVLPEPLPPDGLSLDDPYTPAQRPANTVIVDWVKITK